MALLFVGPGCAGVRGARLYAQGSQALERGDTARAIQDLEAASRLAPNRSDVYNHLGIAYTEAGEPGPARAAFERAVALDCTNQAAQENLEQLGPKRVKIGPPAGQ
ncbi:MAG: tetratricopeptide repeat protein [Myxococcota bacterium]|nr:tetratricopeptide repeat protein [Myxococcota bacterium]